MPAKLEVMHPVFNISLLKMCVGEPTFVVTFEIMAVKDSISYEDVPIKILDHQV